MRPSPPRRGENGQAESHAPHGSVATDRPKKEVGDQGDGQTRAGAAAGATTGESAPGGAPDEAGWPLSPPARRERWLPDERWLPRTGETAVTQDASSV